MPKGSKAGSVSSRVFVRVPLRNGKFSSTQDGSFLYIEGVDLDRLFPTLGLYVKPALADRRTGWIRYTGVEAAQQSNSISEEDIKRALKEKLDRVFETYPILLDNPIFADLVKSLSGLGEVISAAENRNFDELESALDDFSWQLISGLSGLVQLQKEVAESHRLNQSLTSAVEHISDGDQKYLMGFAEAVKNYHAAVMIPFTQEDSLRQRVERLRSDANALSDTVISLKTSEIALEDEVVMCSLGISDEIDSEQILGSVVKLSEQVAESETDRAVLLEEVKSLKEKLFEITNFAKEAYKCKLALDPFLSSQDIGQLFLEKWLDEEVCRQTQGWLNDNAHSTSFWDSRLSPLNSELIRIENRLVNGSYNTTKLTDWQKMLQVGVHSSVQPSPIDPVLDTAAENEDFQVAGTDFFVEAKTNHPSSLAEVMELFELYAASKTDSTNYLWSMTFKSALEVIAMAGFNLTRVNLKAFRDYIRKHPMVLEVDDCEDVKNVYQSLREQGNRPSALDHKHLLWYKVDARSPNSRERFKITQWYAKSPTITALEQKWGVTKERLKELAKLRVDQKRKNFEEKKNSRASV